MSNCRVQGLQAVLDWVQRKNQAANALGIVSRMSSFAQVAMVGHIRPYSEIASIRSGLRRSSYRCDEARQDLFAVFFRNETGVASDCSKVDFDSMWDGRLSVTEDKVRRLAVHLSVIYSPFCCELCSDSFLRSRISCASATRFGTQT